MTQDQLFSTSIYGVMTQDQLFSTSIYGVMTQDQLSCVNMLPGRQCPAISKQLCAAAGVKLTYKLTLTAQLEYSCCVKSFRQQSSLHCWYISSFELTTPVLANYQHTKS